MNFYLVPLVSYQTQQKMKSHVTHHRSRSKDHHSKERRASTRSSVSTAAGSRVSIDSGNSGTTACTTAASIKTKSSRDKSISNASLIDYYGRSLVALEAPKHALNYDSVADVNEFLEVKREQTRRNSGRKHRNSGSGANSIASSRDPIQCQLLSEEPESLAHPSAKTIDEIPAPVLMAFKDIDFDGRDPPSEKLPTESETVPEDGSTARNSASEPELTRCYSDESSIFSIRESDKERRSEAKVKNTTDKKPKSKPKRPPVEIISNAAEPPAKGFSRFIKKLT
jgi:hypothetical protein